MFKIGDVVATNSNVFWHGEDVGDRLGKVIDVKSWVLINLYDYDDNPVRCFHYELERSILKSKSDITDIDIDEFLKDIDDIMLP